MYSRLLLFLLLWLGSDDEFKFATCFVTVGCWKRVAKVVVFLGNECFMSGYDVYHLLAAQCISQNDSEFSAQTQGSSLSASSTEK